MVQQVLRPILAPVSALLLIVGLAPAPAAADIPGLPESAPLELAAEPAPPPTGELLDVYSGFEPGTAELPAAAADGSSTSPAGVATEVAAAVEADGSAPVIVRLREQPDLAAIAQDAARAGRAVARAGAPDPAGLAEAERNARGQVVVRALRSVARESQAEVADLLADQRDVQEFWIFNGFSATVDEAGLAALTAHPEVASVTLDETIVLDEPEPVETGEPRLPVWSLESINATDAWGDHGVRGDDVVVGVMDSGVDGGHPALAAAWRGNHSDLESSWFVATDEDYPEPGDGNGHGTHVTGSIVGAPPGEVTGVAPDAQWIAAKIFRDNGSTTASMIHAAFEWMLAPGGDPSAAPHVVNNSWGSDDTHYTEFWDDVAAWEAAGIVPVFANGNSGPGTGTVGAPASFPHAIGVGATDAEDRVAYFSSRGPVVWDGVEYTKPQVSAPGYDVLSSYPGGGYELGSGTSMAAPHVTGVTALMLSAAPGLSIDEVRETLQGTARSESHMAALPHAYGAGVVDAHAAVTAVAHRGQVRGTVTDRDGAPVEATITAGDQTARTDQAGGYALWLPAGTHELTIAGYGHQRETRQVTVTVGGVETLDVALATAEVHPLAGTVTGPAGPVPDARVTLAGTSLPAVRTDGEGRFRFSAAEGSYELRVSAAGYAPSSVDVSVGGDGTGVAVTLEPLAGATEPGWAQYQNNPARTGLAGEPLAAETVEAAWTGQAGGQVLFSSPVLAGGRVFVNTDNGTLAALDAATGESLWTFEGSDGMRGAPAVAGGLVYTGGGADGGIHAVDAATGAPRWSVPTPGRRTIYTAPVVRDGIVYAATGYTPDRSDTLFALDAATGEELWSAEIGPRAFFGPAVADGMVVASSAGDRRLVALDAATGAQRWSLEREDEFIASPSIADGTVYVATSVPPPDSQLPFQGSLLAVDAATGELEWEATSHGDGQGTAPAVHGDLVIAGSHGLGMVAAYDRATGEPVWHYGLATSGGVSASILVSGDGYVVGGAQLDQRIFMLDADTGELVWEREVDANVVSSPAYADGQLVVADRGGTLRAFHPTGQVAGMVTGPDGPLPATVTLVGTAHTAEADPATGRFAIAGIPPGEYTVEVSQFGFATHTRTIQVRAGQVATVDATLPEADDGAVAGTVRDGDGRPLPGAEVTLVGTPLNPVATGDDGGYAFDEVAAGSYQIVADAPGYAGVEETVAVTAGETTVADFTLGRFDVAVVADHQSRVTDVLAAAGIRVERLGFDDVLGNLDRYRAVVVAGEADDRADADPDRFARIVAEADEAGTSLVFLGTGGPSYGSIRTLSRVTGDPATEAGVLAGRGEVWLEEVADHPITASLAGQRVSLLESSSWHAWFADYTGYSLAAIGNDRDGRLGDGVGYQRRTLESNHILLPAAAPSPWSDWQPVMADLLVDAVSYAAQAEYGAVTGRVTGAGGDPVPATVEVADGLGQTVADGDGGYRLLLEPGEHTLRFRYLGAETVETTVTITAGVTHELNPSLPDPALGVLTGQVTDADRGTPVAGATVSVASERSSEASDAAGIAAGLPPVTTGPDGAYLVEQVPGGSYTVEITTFGYEPLVRDGVQVTDGSVTTLDVTLTRNPAVVVVGDRNGEISGFLEEHAIPTDERGWEVVEDLEGVEVVILHNPPDPGGTEFLAALDAFDEAGVSVIFPADGWSTRTRGIDLLVRHTGNPSGYGRLGGFSGEDIFLHDLAAGHPLFAGIEGDPVRLLNPSSEAAYFPDYTGVTLAQVGEGEAEPAGIGIAYDARTPDSVHLLLSGLAATFRNTPGANWTRDGQQILVNAVRWAASPGMGGLAGTVTGPEQQPIPEAEVEVVGTGWRATTDARGEFELGVPPGEYTVAYHAFGYISGERTVTVVADQTVDASAELAVGEVGGISGVVSSSDGGALAGVEVTLRDTPHRTVTAADGSYRLTRVEPGSYDLELEVDGHVRTLAEVQVAIGATTERDLTLRAAPLVGIIDDSGSASSRDRGQEFLRDWGYEVEEVAFGSLDRIAELDLVVANVASTGLSVGAAELAAFEDAVNRAGVPVLWLGQHSRGAIEFLHEHHGDPGVVGQGWNDGGVTATVVDDHPLVAGLDGEFPLLTPNSRYSYFDEFGGTAVATLGTEDGGTLGETIAYRGRTTGAVDVLLSTLSISTLGAPGTRGSPAVGWTPEAERVLVNALAWALDADAVGAEVRGTIQDEAGEPVPSTVTVAGTGRVYESDGSFLVPLRPGSWTLEITAFGYEPHSLAVTVEAGAVATETVTLTALPSGTLTGTVTAPDGTGIADAEVAVTGTPLAATTGPDGTYAIERAPAGDGTLRVTADGYRAAQLPVTVTAGQTTTADVPLRDTAEVAVVDTTGSSSYGRQLEALLASEGYEVELVPRNDLAGLAERIGDYDLVIFNATLLNSQQEAFGAAVDAAAEGGVSAIYASQWGSGYPIPKLSAYRGDPATVDWGFISIGIDYLPAVDHPIFAGFPAGEPIELLNSTLSNQNQQWAGYGDWSGETIANVHARDGEDLGEAVGYRFTSPTSVEVLLGSLGAGSYGSPETRWTGDARRIYLNAVGWALDATQAQLTGVVSGGGEPLAGATVSSVETGATATTDPDGSYLLGLPAGTHTIEVSAFGYVAQSHVVEMTEAGTVPLDADLAPLPRGSLTGTVTSTTGEPVAGANLTGTGPLQWTATTGPDGGYTAGDPLEGEYEVAVVADGFLPVTGTVTVTADAPATLDLTMQPTNVGVLGDVEGALTSYLRDAGVPADSLAWDADLEVGRYEVLVVNGGSPDAATFEAVLAAADEAEVSLVFTGTWAVDRGGIRLLERYTDRVEVGAQGYGDGPVQLTGFDPDHPMFAGLGSPPATLIVEGGYYSVLDQYAGQPLADLRVARDGDEPVTGLAVGWDWRTAGSVEVLLSASAVTDAVGPGLGWTPEGGRLVVDAIEWARDAKLARPEAPTLVPDAPVTLTETVTVSGEAAWPAEVTVLRDGEPVATVATEGGTWSAEVPLAAGDNLLTAVASNLAGESPASAPVTVTRWVPEWEVRGQWPARPVTLRLEGASPWTDPADHAELVVLDADGNEVRRAELRWVNGFYLHVLRDLPQGDYTLRAELTVDGHSLVSDGPALD